MAVKPIVDGAYLVPLGGVNAVLLEDGRDLVLVDTGWPGKEGRILEAVAALGRAPADLKHIVLTHGHSDHIGSAAALVRATGAQTTMHPADVGLAEGGGPFRPMTAAPGLLQKVMFRLLWNQNSRTEPFRVDRHMSDGETLDLAGGLGVVHVPGHCAGQVALLWRGGRLLLAADACTNLLGLSDPIGFEDRAEGRRSQRKLAGLGFEAAAFGHGGALRKGADARFRKAFG